MKWFGAITTRVSIIGIAQGHIYEVLRGIPIKKPQFYRVKDSEGNTRTIPVDKFERGSANDE